MSKKMNTNTKMGKRLEQVLNDLPNVVIRVMQIKMTIRYYYTASWMAKNKQARQDQCWWGCGIPGMLIHCWWNCKLVQTCWKLKISIKVRIHMTYNPAIEFQDLHVSMLNIKVYIWAPKNMNKHLQRGI